MQESTHKFIQLLTKQLREQRQKAQDLEEKLADKNDDIKKFINECKTRMVRLEEKVKLHDKAIERLEKKTQDNSTRIEQLEAQFKDLRADVDALK